MKELCLKYGIVTCPKSEPTSQMVLGTGNQEEEPSPRKGLPPMPPETGASHSSRIVWCFFLVSKRAPISGSTPSTKPTRVCPLVETGGEFGPTRVHKPFSLLELRQIKQDLESYTDDPGKYIDTFQHITLALAWCGRTSWSYLAKLYLTLSMLGSWRKPEGLLQGFTCQAINTQ